MSAPARHRLLLQIAAIPAAMPCAPPSCLSVSRLDAVGPSLRRHDYLDVPALQKRDYILNFHALREGSTAADVTFTNERTGEYVRYAVNVKATAPPVASTIALSGAVRQLVEHTLDVENPLDRPVTFAVACDVPDVFVPPSLTLGAGVTGVLSLGWRPLVQGTREGKLTLTSPELGAFTHKLSLVAIGAADLRTLQFKAGLGGSQLQSFRFTNYLRSAAPAVYKCAVKAGPDFEVVARDVSAPPADGTTGTEVSVSCDHACVSGRSARGAAAVPNEQACMLQAATATLCSRASLLSPRSAHS